MRNRSIRQPREVVLPRVKLMVAPEGWVVVLECLCGHAVQYPGHADDPELSRCEVCNLQWRCLDTADLLRALGG